MSCLQSTQGECDFIQDILSQLYHLFFFDLLGLQSRPCYPQFPLIAVSTFGLSIILSKLVTNSVSFPSLDRILLILEVCAQSGIATVFLLGFQTFSKKIP
ncbi:hypothetical protein BDF14DRAFT_306213 [Spinellus fusiger]|nr:hypothetical protein BDF14DRAFT_306213 [Spinellus fusiger]